MGNTAHTQPIRCCLRLASAKGSQWIPAWRSRWRAMWSSSSLIQRVLNPQVQQCLLWLPPLRKCCKQSLHSLWKLTGQTGPITFRFKHKVRPTILRELNDTSTSSKNNRSTRQLIVQSETKVFIFHTKTIFSFTTKKGNPLRSIHFLGLVWYPGG